MTDPENLPELTHEEAIVTLAVDMPEVKEATPDAVNEADRSTELETPTEATSETTHTPPSPDHLAFLNSLPTGEYGLSVQVYADRVEEDGLFDAAHVLRHHDAYLEYPKRLFALHRSICSQIERIFGCRYARRARRYRRQRLAMDHQRVHGSSGLQGLGGGRPPPCEWGEAIGAVGLGRPDRVEPEVFGRREHLGHPDRRTGEPVPEDQTELEIVICHGRER